jgi:hypothetical protein
MDDNFIYKVNISGTIYHITRKTLLKIPYFADYYKDYDGDHSKEIFVERSPELFKDVYAYILDPLHPYPIKYYYELDKYGIIYDKDKLYCDIKYICKAEDCDNFYYKKGDLYCEEHSGKFCGKCYINIPKPNTHCLNCRFCDKYICKAEDCDNFYYDKGDLYCDEHNGNYCYGDYCYNKVPTDGAYCKECKSNKIEHKYVCKMEGCDEFYTNKGDLYCENHYGKEYTCDYYYCGNTVKGPGKYCHRCK